MAQQFTTIETVTYTPPKAAPNSGVSTLGTTGVYNASSIGSIDIPNGTTVDTIIPVPFNQVTNAKVIIIRNEMSSDIGIRLNGAVADSFQLGAGGEFKYENPTTPASNPIDEVSVVTKVDPTATQYIYFLVFGD
jgi:hypothetical protein